MNSPQNNLSPMQRQVLEQKATEVPFSGVLNDNKKPGTYVCGGCGAVLFSSDSKFDSGSGWPSFSDVVSESAVKTVDDFSHGMIRKEVVCSACGGHLGHLFDDGPKDSTGLRFCINSAALNFMSANNDEMIRGDGEKNETS
jgi:peptide-methionine (R)-S-oxide reductase